MEIKETKKTFAYIKRLETTLRDIGKYVGNTPQQLIVLAAQEGFKVSGPQFWNYYGVDGNPDTKIQIEICLPIEETKELSSENTAIIEGFRCAATRVKGPWSNLKGAYENLIAEMAENKMSPGVWCREIYHEIDFDQPENNVTEIQLGIN